MLRKLFVILSVLVVGLLALAACGGNQASAPAPTNTPIAQASVSEVTVASEEKVASEEPAANTAEMTEASASAETAASTESVVSEESAEDTQEMADADAVPEAEESEAIAQEASVVRTFAIVSEDSKASYIVAEEFFGGALDRLGIQPGLVDTIGSTQEVEGEMQLDLSNLSSPLGSNHFIVNIRSLTSNQSRRDQRIRTNDLESDKYPLAEFTITSLESVPEAYSEGEEVTFKANGDITIREITTPVTFDVTAKLEGETITGVASTQLKMTDFGFDPPNLANLFSVADDFTVELQFTFKEQ